MAGPWEKYQQSGVASNSTRGQLEPGNIDLAKRPVVRNADGTISTVRSISANFDGREVLIPTVSDDGKILSDDDAIALYQATGRNLGSFDTPENATAYAESLHSDQDRMYSDGPWSKYSTQSPALAEDRIVDLPAVQATRPDPTDDMSGTQRFLAGVGKSIADSATGVAQFLSSDAAPLVSGLPGLVTRELGKRGIGAAADQRATEARELDRPLMQTGAGLAGNIIGGIAQTAVPVGGAAGRAAGLLGKAAPYVGAATRGAAFAGAQSVTGDESRVQNAAVGGAAGAVGQGIASGLGAAASRAKDVLNPVVQQSINSARQAGIPLHIAQVTDSRFLKGVASVLNKLPFTGGDKAVRGQQEAFNRAVAKTFGTDASALSDDVMAQARQGIGSVYDNVFARNNVNLERQDIARLLMVEREAHRSMTADQAAVVSNQVQRIVDEFASGPASGEKYQALRSVLGNLVDGSKEGAAIKALRTAVDEAAFRSVGPADAATLRQANSMWANMRTAEDALKQAAGSRGDIAPGNLWNLVRSGSTKEMRELAKVGKNVIQDPIPNSGSPERLMVLSSLGMGGSLTGTLPLALKAAAVGATAGRVMNSPLAANALIGLRPANAVGMNALARLGQGAPYALPPAALATLSAGAAQAAPTEEERRKARQKGRSP